MVQRLTTVWDCSLSGEVDKQEKDRALSGPFSLKGGVGFYAKRSPLQYFGTMGTGVFIAKACYKGGAPAGIAILHRTNTGPM